MSWADIFELLGWLARAAFGIAVVIFAGALAAILCEEDEP